MNETILTTAPVRYLDRGEPGRIWRRSQRRRYDVEPRRHAELVVLFGISGQMHYFIDGALVAFGAGSLLFAHADQAHFLVDDSPNFDMVVAVLAPEILNPNGLHPPTCRATRADSGADCRVLTVDARDELLTLADQLIAYDEPEALKIGLSWWLHRAWSHWTAAEIGDITATHPAVAHALAAIRADPALSLTAVAKSAGLSLSRLGQAFRQEAGMTMQAYRTGRRLDLVERRLRSTPGLPLLTAAFDAGFGDYSSFYRACRTHRGQSPAAIFRKADR